MLSNNQNLIFMGQFITLTEAVLISISTVLIWALIKTILETIENKNK